MAKKIVTLHIHEKYEHPLNGPIYESWLSCPEPHALTLDRRQEYTALYAQTAGQAIASRVEAEKQAWALRETVELVVDLVRLPAEAEA